MASFLPWLDASLVNPSPEHARWCGCGSGADKSKLRRKQGKAEGCGADRAAGDVEGLPSLHHRCEGIAPPLPSPPRAGTASRVPDQGVAGAASTAFVAWAQARWSRSWRLMARSIASADPHLFT